MPPINQGAQANNQRMQANLYRYGYCENTEGRCSNAELDRKGKRKILEIGRMDSFVCPLCHKPLTECPPPVPPEPWWKKIFNPKIILPLILILAIIGACIYGFTVYPTLNKGDLGYATWDGDFLNGQPNGEGTLVFNQSYSFTGPDNKVRNVEPGDYITAIFSNGELQEGVWYDERGEVKGEIPDSTHDLGYATWEGELKDGRPDGEGTLTYKQSYAIDSPDGVTRTADPDDYITATFSDGKLVSGTWYSASSVVKGVIPELKHDLGYAIWEGELKDSKPEGSGTMTYAQANPIEGPDARTRTAEAGDYIKGEYSDGKLVKGSWFSQSNVHKGDIPGAFDLGDVTWDGELKNGLPDGEGTLSYVQSKPIECSDARTRTAEVGDYIKGVYSEGKLVKGNWFSQSNVHKGDVPGAFDLGYATWDGELKDGLPNGQGTLTYLQSKAIEGPDDKARTADAGDYIKGNYTDGKLVNGTWFGKNKSKKGVIPEPKVEKLDLGYALWEGFVKNKKPHGQGVMKFKQSHLIDSRDINARIAEPGDYITGEYYEGHLVMGKWYSPIGTEKGSINIGR